MSSPRRLAAGAVVLAACAATVASGTHGAHASAARTSVFPLPPAGATVYARQLGDDALALAVVPRAGGAVLVQASVLGRQGDGVRGLQIAFTVRGRRRAASACGAGCYRASFGAGPAPTAVEVALPGGARPWHVALPAAWPPRPATQLVARAGRAYRALHSLTFRERLASGTDHAAVSTWRVQAPDRLAYEVEDGWAGVVIGDRRWDRAPGSSTWKSSAQTPLHQPVPFWVSVEDARILGDVTYNRRPAVLVSFFDRGSHAWFTLVVERRTLRTLDSRMVTNAHFMHDSYSAFDSTAPVVPPR